MNVQRLLVRAVKSALKATPTQLALLYLFDMTHYAVCGRAKKAVLDGFMEFDASAETPPILVAKPNHHPEASVLLGAGAASGITARRAAELYVQGKTGNVFYMTGGEDVENALLSKKVLKTIRAYDQKQGAKVIMPLPEKGEREGDYSKRVFLAEVKARAEECRRNGVDPSKLKIIVENEGLNFSKHLENIKAGAKYEHSLALFVLPYGIMRGLGTHLKVYGDDQAVLPVAAWLPELGIRKEDCESRIFKKRLFPDLWNFSSVLARTVTLQEARKVGFPNPEKAPYVAKRGFCRPVSSALIKARWLNHSMRTFNLK